MIGHVLPDEQGLRALTPKYVGRGVRVCFDPQKRKFNILSFKTVVG